MIGMQNGRTLPRLHVFSNFRVTLREAQLADA
jgi:hypothetical protein